MKRKLSSKWRVAIAAAMVISLTLVMAVPAYAAHTVTPGGTVDIDADTNGGTYTSLNNISFTDLPGTDLANGNTFYLTAPTGFEFNPTAASHQAIGAGYGTLQIDLGPGAGVAQAPVYSGSDTIATWTVTAAGTGSAGSITISGMELRPTAATTTISGIGEDNVTIAGDVTTFNTPNAHPIDHVPGVQTAYTVVTENTGTEVAGAGFSITLDAVDQHGNVNDDGANLVTGAVDITWTSTATNAPDGTPPTQIADGNQTFSLGTVTTGTDWTLTNAGQTPTITATSAGPLTGTSASITVNPDVLAAYTVVPAALTQTASVAFDVVITAVDVYENPLGTDYTDPTGAYTWVTNATGSPDIGTTPVFANFTAGVVTRSVTLDAIETGVTFTITDNNSKTGTSAGVAVVAGATDYFTLSTPNDINTGTRATYTVTRYDVFNNLVTSGTQLVYLYTSSSGSDAAFYDAASGGNAITFVTIADAASAASFWYFDRLIGDWTITASDDELAADGIIGIDDATDALTVKRRSGGGAWTPPAPSDVETNLFGSVSSFSISSSGKAQETITATSADGDLTLTIPKDTIALDEDGNPLSTLISNVNVSPPTPPEGRTIIGRAYDFGPSGATFNPPITLEFTYDPAEVPQDGDLVVASYDEATGGWLYLPSTVDPVTYTITASVGHFTTFAVIARTPVEGAPPAEEAPPVEEAPPAEGVPPPTVPPPAEEAPPAEGAPPRVNWAIWGTIIGVGVFLAIFLPIRRRRKKLG